MSQPPAPENLNESKIPWLATGCTIILFVLLYFLNPEFKSFLDEAWTILSSEDKEKTTAWVNSFGWFGPVLLILAMVAQMFLVLMPSIILIVVSMVAYGPVLGSIISFVGIYLASSVGYFIGWYFGPVLIGKLIGNRTREKGSFLVRKYGFWLIFLTRLSPFLYNDAISLITGILKMGYWKFIGANLAGIAPLIILIAILGGSIEGLQTTFFFSSIFSLIIFGLYAFFNYRKNTPKVEENERILF